MAPEIITVRVRPSRSMVLVNADSSRDIFVKVTRFLTQIWGGRFHSILPVTADSPDDLTLFRLKHNRPDYVFGVGIDEKIWKMAVHNASQPREYRSLKDNDLTDDIRDLIGLRFCHSDRAVISLFEARLKPSAISRPLKVVETASKEWNPYISAMYGNIDADVDGKYRDELLTINTLDTSGFIKLHKDFVEGRKISWLDAGSFGLNRIRDYPGYIAPTIVIVGDGIADLSHFWNLRAIASSTDSSWVIPIPSEVVHLPEVHEALSDWLAASPWHATPDYCTITTSAATEGVTTCLADGLKKSLKNTAIKNIDVIAPQNRLPRIIPFENETAWPAELEGRRLTIVPPSITTFKPHGHREYWLVDLVKDNKTGRAVGEMCFPRTAIMPDIINSPCPPQAGLPSPRRFAHGHGSVNILCSGNQKPVSWYIPRAEEVIEETLLEHGLNVQSDEKRNIYLPVIERFGGLYQTAKALSGDQGKVLETLRSGRVRSIEEMRQLDVAKQSLQLGAEGFVLLAEEIRGRAGLKTSKLGEERSIEDIRLYLRSESQRVQRIGIERSIEYWDGRRPTDATIQALLEHWANQRIVRRKWQVGPCRKCEKKKVFVDHVDLNELPPCPHCGATTSIRGGFEVAYSLEPTVRNALNEGMGTVVLAGQFLKNLSQVGFFWLPGVKYKGGDIDLLACCDGRFVFGECKGLADTPLDADTWRPVTDQFLDTAAVARECNGDIAILAAMVEEFPIDVRNRIEKELTGKIPYLLLDKRDLETGFREERGEIRSRMSLRSVIPILHPERVNDIEGTRTIRMGGMTHTVTGQ